MILPLPDQLAEIALRAGDLIMSYYGSNPDAARKPDNSPVTIADDQAEQLILTALAGQFPDIPAVSEEAVARDGVPPPCERFFLIDPLDGTREFLKLNGEFTVNIALIEDARPILGVVYAPARRELYWTESNRKAVLAEPPGHATAPGEARTPDQAAEALKSTPRRTITVREAPEDALIAVSSRSHRDPATRELCAPYKIAEHRQAGSSLKFCLIASGEADFYPRAGRTMEWDTAAGQAVLEAARGSVVDAAGAPLTYGKFGQGLANPPFIARGWR